MDRNDTPAIASRGIHSILSETLTAVLAMLDEVENSAHVRELRARARSYQRIVTSWETVPASEPQRDATLDLVTELHVKAVAVRASGSCRPPCRTRAICVHGGTPRLRPMRKEGDRRAWRTARRRLDRERDGGDGR
jgi:hypothetical protein